MKYDYWKMRGWKKVTMHQPIDDDDDLKTVDEVVETLDDLYNILNKTLGKDNDVFVEEITITDVEETAEEAYDRAMKGV